MRETPNFDDANFALRLYELRREPELRKARVMVAGLSGRPWEEIEPVLLPGHASNAHFRQATSYWEMVASFVNRGIFHVDTYMDTCGEGLLTYWTFRPHVDRIRSMGRPRFLVQTEKLVADHAAARERLDLLERSHARMSATERERASRATAKDGRPTSTSGARPPAPRRRTRSDRTKRSGRPKRSDHQPR